MKLDTLVSNCVNGTDTEGTQLLLDLSDLRNPT